MALSTIWLVVSIALPAKVVYRLSFFSSEGYPFARHSKKSSRLGAFGAGLGIFLVIKPFASELCSMRESLASFRQRFQGMRQLIFGCGLPALGGSPMLIPILAGLAGVLLVAFVLALTMGARRAVQLSELKNKNEELGQLLSAHKTRFDEKCKQIDEFRSKLDRVRDETKRAKKRIFDLEHATDQGEQNDDATREQEEALLEAKAENKAAQKKIALLEEHKAQTETQLDKLKSELVALRRDLDDKKDELEKVKGGKTGEAAELKKQKRKLQEKLDVANRRSKTDAQVYRVTNSKLELAMEKIGTLESRLTQKGKSDKVAKPKKSKKKATATDTTATDTTISAEQKDKQSELTKPSTVGHNGGTDPAFESTHEPDQPPAVSADEPANQENLSISQESQNGLEPSEQPVKSKVV